MAEPWRKQPQNHIAYGNTETNFICEMIGLQEKIITLFFPRSHHSVAFSRNPTEGDVESQGPRHLGSRRATGGPGMPLHVCCRTLKFFLRLHRARFPLLTSEEPSSAHGWSMLSHVDEAAQEVSCRCSLPCSCLRSYWAQLWARVSDMICISAVNTVFLTSSLCSFPNMPSCSVLSSPIKIPLVRPQY